jgi:hypothetical protein
MILALITALAIAQTEEMPEHTEQPYEEKAFSLRLFGGPRYRLLYGVPIIGGEFDIALGASWGTTRAYGGAVFAYGRTKHNLSSVEVRPMGILMTEVDRFAFGGALGLGYLNVHRITLDEVVWRLSMSLSGIAELDIIRTDSGALFMGVIATGEVPLSWVATAGLGWRN